MIEIDFLKKKARYQQTDIGTSNLFIDTFKDELVYCSDIGDWYFWNGKHWQRDTILRRNELLKQLYSYCIKYLSTQKLDQKEQAQLLSYYCKLADKNFRDKILKDALSVNPMTSKQFDKHKFLFNCQNGTYDFTTGEFREHRKDDFLTDMSNVVYDKEADCPRFKQYLEEVFEDDKTKADYLLKMSAYCLTGDTSRECFFVLYGDKTRNGKGTFVSTFTHLAGTYSQTLNPASITKKQLNSGGSAPSPDIAKLKNCRIASVSELEEGMVLNVALMKTFTGGDTQTARFLHKEEFEFIPQFKIIINTNVLPKMSDDSIFKSDRIHLLCFDRHFELNERDYGLKDKLKSETSGIFNLIAQYYFKLNQENFVLPDTTKSTIERYQLNSNNILLFIKENMYANSSSYEKASVVYEKYTKWCEDCGYKSLGKKTFRERFERQGAEYIEKSRHTTDEGISDVSMWYKGYTFTEKKHPIPIEISQDELPF